MNFEIDVSGRSRQVSVERRTAARYVVVVDGREFDVDAVRVGTYGLSLVLAGHASLEATIAPAGQPGQLLVGLAGRPVAVALNSRHTARAGADAGGAHGDVTIVAPMPGRVVRVLVAPGDEVVAKQGVIVVEAMKMENELRAPRAGRVKDVSVSPGTPVEAGRALVVIE